MLHVTPEMRRTMVMAKKAGKKTKEIAEFLGVSRKTVWKWNKEKMVSYVFFSASFANIIKIISNAPMR